MNRMLRLQGSSGSVPSVKRSNGVTRLHSVVAAALPRPDASRRVLGLLSENIACEVRGETAQADFLVGTRFRV